MWVNVAQLCGMNIVKVGDVASIFEFWLYAFPMGHKVIVWRLALFSLLWAT